MREKLLNLNVYPSLSAISFGPGLGAYQRLAPKHAFWREFLVPPAVLKIEIVLEQTPRPTWVLATEWG